MVRLLSVILAFGLCATAGTAFAQDGAPEYVWVTATSSATRFLAPDSTEVEKTNVGDKLQVVYREADRIRLRFKGSKFGWVDASTVSNSEPSDPTTAP